MKIQSLNNLYRTNFLNRKQSETNNNYRFNNSYTGDVVSFRAKNYDSNSIVNPTGHCAYCGCKVYTEAQIEALAKGMLGNKSHRLQGDIKSVLEKLDSAVRSEELTFAKKVENGDEILFFKKLLQVSSDNAYLKGEEIFKNIYNMDSKEALDALKLNMRPLTKTIDHVSPQNLDEENNNADVNLVEACYCCNHDLKKGVTFAEFYAMFPSIKENMPVDKFNYAHSNLMAAASETVMNRMSAANLLKHIERLLGQRREAMDRVSSVEFRIYEADSSINSSIEACRSEIESKTAQRKEAEAKLESLSNDDEYNALVKRIQLSKQKDEYEAVITSLRDRRQVASNQLNEIRTPSKKQKKQAKLEMSKEEKDAKIAELKETIATLNTEIESQQDLKDDVELQIIDLDEHFPTIEILQVRKNKADYIVSSHIQLAKEKSNLAQLQSSYSTLEGEITSLNDEIAKFPKEDFDATKYSPEEQDEYARYLQCLEAQKHIETHSSGGGVKAVINSAAKPFIDAEIVALRQTPIVMASINFDKRKELQSQLDSKQKQKSDVYNKINASKKQISNLESTTKKKSQEEASAEVRELVETIRRLNEKQNYLTLPRTIATLNAEIILLTQTIDDLSAKQSEISGINRATP